MYVDKENMANSFLFFKLVTYSTEQRLNIFMPRKTLAEQHDSEFLMVPEDQTVCA